MWRRIIFPAKITLEYKAVRGIGFREALLLAIAALQAVWLVFLVDAIDFALRLTLAVFIALALIGIATIPVRGYRAEQYVLVVLRGLLRPKVYLHQTAQREEADYPPAVPPPKRPIRPEPAPAAAAEWQGDWAGPNIGLVLAVFLLILAVGSAIAWLSGGGARVLPSGW